LIIDDDPPPPPEFLAADVRVIEGSSGTTEVPLPLSRLAAQSRQRGPSTLDPNQLVTLDYATADGTATAFADYLPSAGTLTFDGEPSPRLRVLGDTLAEPNETFFVDFSNPNNAVLDGARATVTIVDDDANRPPSCSGVVADKSVLWPPNHKLRPISLSGASDPDGDAVALHVTRVSQDEPVVGVADAALVPTPGQVRLRAERDGRGDGRVYRIEFSATDARGASCSSAVRVSVPHSRRSAAVDSAPPSYDSYGS
jgi:hypothetical protein